MYNGTLDNRVASFRQAAEAVRRMFPNLIGAPGSHWYDIENRVMRIEAESARVPSWRVAAYLGASSINTSPDLGRKWVYARLRGDYSKGHVPSAVRAWERVESAKTWEDARSALVTPKSRARKILNFACNIFWGGGICGHAVPCVTIDRWMVYLGSFGTAKYVPDGGDYDTFAGALRIVAAEYGMTPANFQAVLWVAVADKTARSIIAQDGKWVTR